ncbi:MAG: MarC family protein [Deltaproteobacteria bacterium]|nr:MarC family protein [Deltaproteobacteria bacterium]
MDWKSYLFFVFPSILVILNPIGAASIFASLSFGRPTVERRRLALKACRIAFGVLLFFFFLGHILFEIFGITIGAFRIAGGFLLFGVAWQMLQSYQVRMKGTEEEFEEGAQKEDIAVVPLAIPVLSGPGAITTIMVLSGGTKHWWQTLILIACMAIAFIITYFVLIHAVRLLGILKITGLRVVSRIMGLILAVVAIQFVIDGIKNILPEMARLIP